MTECIKCPQDFPVCNEAGQCMNFGNDVLPGNDCGGAGKEAPPCRRNNGAEERRMQANFRRAPREAEAWKNEMKRRIKEQSKKEQRDIVRAAEALNAVRSEGDAERILEAERELLGSQLAAEKNDQLLEIANRVGVLEEKRDSCGRMFANSSVRMRAQGKGSLIEYIMEKINTMKRDIEVGKGKASLKESELNMLEPDAEWWRRRIPEDKWESRWEERHAQLMTFAFRMRWVWAQVSGVGWDEPVGEGSSGRARKKKNLHKSKKRKSRRRKSRRRKSRRRKSRRRKSGRK